MVDMQKLTHGVLHTKFWVVDQTHFYIGSANMDWRSLTQVCLHPTRSPFPAPPRPHRAPGLQPHPSSIPASSVSSLCNGFLPTSYQASLNIPKSSPALTAFPPARGSLGFPLIPDDSCQPFCIQGPVHRFALHYSFPECLL